MDLALQGVADTACVHAEVVRQCAVSRWNRVLPEGTIDAVLTRARDTVSRGTFWADLQRPGQILVAILPKTGWS
eukprot:5266640-Pyramimonas_sp.AAC.1